MRKSKCPDGLNKKNLNRGNKSFKINYKKYDPWPEKGQEPSA